VVNRSGEVVGILRSGIEGYEGLNFATKMSSVSRLIGSWIGATALEFPGCSDEESMPQSSSEGHEDRWVEAFCFTVPESAWGCIVEAETKKVIRDGAVRPDESAYISSIEYIVLLNDVPIAGPYLEVDGDANFSASIEGKFPLDQLGVYSIQGEVRFVSGETAEFTSRIQRL